MKNTWLAAFIALGLGGVASLGGAEETAWIEVRRGPAAAPRIRITVAPDGRATVQVQDAMVERTLSRYRMNYLRILIDRLKVMEGGADPGVPGEGEEVHLVVRDGGREKELVARAAAPGKAPVAGPAAWRVLEDGIRWAAEAGLDAAQAGVQAAERKAAAGDAGGAGVLALGAVAELRDHPGPYALSRWTDFYWWRIPCEHPVHSLLPAALDQAAAARQKRRPGGPSGGDAAGDDKTPDELVALARRFLDAQREIDRDALAGLEQRLMFFAPGESESDYADPWERAATQHPSRPDQWGEGPWAGAKLPEGWEESRLGVPEEPNVGVSFVRRCAWAAATPERADAGEPPFPAGARLLGRQVLATPADATAGVADFAILSLARDVGLQETLERAMAGQGAHRVRAYHWRRLALHATDLIYRTAGDEVVRWVAVQSGGRAVILRARAKLAAWRDLRAPLARLVASLEPRPLAPCTAAEPVCEQAFGALKLELPDAWTLTDVPGAPAGGEFRDALAAAADGAAGGFRLFVRAAPSGKLAVPAGLWSTFAHPRRDSDKAAGPALVDPRGPIARVCTAGKGLAVLERGELPFAGERLPLLWFSVSDGSVQAVVGLVCASSDEASLSRARAWIERIAGSAR